MKKSILFMMAVVGLLTACDPSNDDISTPGNSDLTSEQLSNGFSFRQYSDENYTTEAADGNYFTFFTSPSRVVTIYQKDADGARIELVSGLANGKFRIVPKRGNPTSQTFYIETRDFNGNIITGEKTVNVYVPTELSPEMRLLASDAYGYKVWTWDTEFRDDGGVWGNLGYAPGPGDTFCNEGNGIWWGCPPADLTGQMQHSDTGVATGEENPNAYMEFYDDGNIITYDAGGNQIRKGKYSVEGWTGERDKASKDGSQANWSYGTLKTTAGSILFPFQINSHSDDHPDKTTCPTEFEIMQLDANHLKLIYPQANTGGWQEATWWAFKSNSDAESSLTDFGTKSWTWDTEFRDDGGVWGNLGYAAGSGDTFCNEGNGIWWGCPPADLTGQMQHSDTGNATGEEDAGAYMTFDWKTFTIKSYDASGKEIRSGKFEIQNWGMGKRNVKSADGSQEAWAYGTLHTDAGSILFPFQINSHSDDHPDKTTCPTDFEILQLDGNHLKLIYPQVNTGGWQEATWWAFKKK